VNSQPWHFLIASTPAGRARIAKAPGQLLQRSKVRNASHVVVLCARKTLDDAHLSAVLDQEQLDGRFATPEAMATQDKSRRFYVGLHQTELKDERYWIERQVYLALGTCSSAPVACRSMPAPWKASTRPPRCRTGSR
jgi:nitroreductase/dihydropteridine reductase